MSDNECPNARMAEMPTVYHSDEVTPWGLHREPKDQRGKLEANEAAPTKHSDATVILVVQFSLSPAKMFYRPETS